MTKLENNKIYKALTIVVVLLTIVVLLLGILPKMFSRCYAVGNNGMDELSFSLSKGDYAVSVSYSAETDIYLEGFYTAQNQEFVLCGILLPATNGISDYTFDLPMPISVRNDSIRFRVPQNDEKAYSIEYVSIKSKGIPLWNIFVLFVYCLSAAAMFTLSKKKDEYTYSLIYTIISTFMCPLLLESKALLLLWYLALLICIYFVLKGKIALNNENIVCWGFLILSFTVLLIFSTSSPLYVTNIGCDSNIYYSVGSAMANGRELYTEAFDHKGPLLFILFELLYILIPTSFSAVWLFEVLMLTIDLCLVYKIAAYYLSKRLSIVAAIISLCTILPSSYFISGASYEELILPMVLGMFYLMMPYIVEKEDAEERKPIIDFALLGVFAAVVFFSKFNVSVMWIVIPLLMCIILWRRYKFRPFAGYVAGWVLIVVFVLLYFIATSGISSLYHYYFEFNIKYGGVLGLREAISRIILNLYDAFMSHKLNAFLILVGLAVTCVSDKYFNIFGKVLIPLSFIVLCGTAYPGYFVCVYYYTLPAIYAFWGITVLLDGLSSAFYDINMDGNVVALSAVLAVISIFFTNDFITYSKFIDYEPKVQEVFAQQMRLFGKDGDVSFFELGFLESGFFAASNIAPTVQYFFLPNSGAGAADEAFNGQFSYLENAETEYFIWAGCSAEDYPNTESIARNYTLLSTYRTPNDVFYMLYRRNN